MVDGLVLMPEGVQLAFCPTGPGGGVDASCGSGGTKTARDPVEVRGDIKRVDDQLRELFDQQKRVKEIAARERADSPKGVASAKTKKLRSDINKQQLSREVVPGMFVIRRLPPGLVLGFCPTGPGGGVDNSCGRGGGSVLYSKGIDNQKELDKLYKERDRIKAQAAKERYEGGGSASSATKKARSEINKKIAELEGVQKPKAPKEAKQPKLKEEGKELPSDVPSAVRYLRAKHDISYTGGRSNKQVVEKAKLVDKELSRLRGKHPRIDGLLKEGNTNVDLMGGSSTRGVMGTYTRYPMTGETVIAFKEALDDYAESRDKPHVGDGSWNVGTDSASVFRHELGHAVFYERMSESERNGWGLLAFSTRRAGVSGYAKTNDSEYFAESFSAFTHPKYKGGMLPEPVEKYLKTTMKGSGEKQATNYSNEFSRELPEGLVLCSM